jgi:hypothetical protein
MSKHAAVNISSIKNKWIRRTAIIVALPVVIFILFTLAISVIIVETAETAFKTFIETWINLKTDTFVRLKRSW